MPASDREPVEPPRTEPRTCSETCGHWEGSVSQSRLSTVEAAPCQAASVVTSARSQARPQLWSPRGFVQEGWSTGAQTPHAFLFAGDSNSGQTPSPAMARLTQFKKKKQQLFAGLCYIIRCWTPAPESSPKYCCSSQLRWVMSVLGTVCTGSEFPFRGTCLSQSSHEKVGQHLTFFFKYTHI